MKGALWLYDGRRDSSDKYKYDEATPFKDGIAKIGKDGKYSLINEDGEIITKRKYTYIGEFYNGVCPVAEGGNTKKEVMTNNGWTHRQ